MKRLLASVCAATLLASGVMAQTGTTQSRIRAVPGQVLKVVGGTVYVDVMGAAVPLQIGPETEFGQGLGPGGTGLQPGQQVIARIQVQNAERNEVVALMLQQNGPGTGGTGPQGAEQAPAQQEEEGGTMIIEPLNEEAEQILTPSGPRE